MELETVYELRFYSSAGVLQARVGNFLELKYRNQVNTPGVCIFAMDAEDLATTYMVKNALVEVWRKVVSRENDETILDWYSDYQGSVKRKVTSYKGGAYILQVTCLGKLSLLDRRHILWYAGTTGRSTFSGLNGETIMKSMVSYNAGSNALVSAGRLRDGVINGISIESDLARGSPDVHWSCAWDNLLDSLQKLSVVAGGDFDLFPTSPSAFEFRFYPGQLGTDRSATLIFSVERGNMANPTLDEDSTEEKTVVLVGGRGDEIDRRSQIVSGPGYSANNDIETFLDARNAEDTLEALITKGQAEAQKRQAVRGLKFDIVQTAGSRYGVDYFVGDLGTAKFLIFAEALKISAAQIDVDRARSETIVIEVENV